MITTLWAGGAGWEVEDWAQQGRTTLISILILSLFCYYNNIGASIIFGGKKIVLFHSLQARKDKITGCICWQFHATLYIVEVRRRDGAWVYKRGQHSAVDNPFLDKGSSLFMIVPPLWPKHLPPGPTLQHIHIKELRFQQRSYETCVQNSSSRDRSEGLSPPSKAWAYRVSTIKYYKEW